MTGSERAVELKNSGGQTVTESRVYRNTHSVPNRREKQKQKKNRKTIKPQDGELQRYVGPRPTQREKNGTDERETESQIDRGHTLALRLEHIYTTRIYITMPNSLYLSII